MSNDDKGSGRLFYLSFADASRPPGMQWLGGCFVEARSTIAAALTAHDHGCNPGGEVWGGEMDDSIAAAVPGEYRGRLLTKHDLRTLGRLMGNDGKLVNLSGNEV